MQIVDVIIFFELRTIQQKTVIPTYLCPLGARKLAEGKGLRSVDYGANDKISTCSRHFCIPLPRFAVVTHHDLTHQEWSFVIRVTVATTAGAQRSFVAFTFQRHDYQSPRAHLLVVGMLRFLFLTETNRACPLLFILFLYLFLLYGPSNCILYFIP